MHAACSLTAQPTPTSTLPNRRSIRRTRAEVTPSVPTPARLRGTSCSFVELLKELVPRLAHLLVVGDPEINVSQFRPTEVTGRVLSVKVQTLEMRHSDAFADVLKQALPES